MKKGKKREKINEKREVALLLILFQDPSLIHLTLVSSENSRITPIKSSFPNKSLIANLGALCIQTRGVSCFRTRWCRPLSFRYPPSIGYTPHLNPQGSNLSCPYLTFKAVTALLFSRAAPPALYCVCPSPSVFEKGTYHCMSAKQW